MEFQIKETGKRTRIELEVGGHFVPLEKFLVDHFDLHVASRVGVLTWSIGQNDFERALKFVNSFKYYQSGISSLGGVRGSHAVLWAITMSGIPAPKFDAERLEAPNEADIDKYIEGVRDYLAFKVRHW